MAFKCITSFINNKLVQKINKYTKTFLKEINYIIGKKKVFSNLLNFKYFE